MHVLFAMGFTTTSDDRGYILWLAQHWTIFIIPAFLLIAVVTVSIIHFARSHSGPGSSGQNPSHADAGLPGTAGPDVGADPTTTNGSWQILSQPA